MVKLLVRDKESIQEAVRRFRKLVDRSGIKKEMRRREYYERPSETKRRASLRRDRRKKRNRMFANRPPVQLKLEIHLPNASPEADEVQIVHLQEAVTEFLETHGYVPNVSIEDVVLISSWHFGRWFKSLWKSRGRQETEEIFADVKEALRRKNIDSVGADSFQKRSEATAKLLKSLEPFDNAVVRLGDVFIAKALIDGKERIAVHTLSPELARALDDNPAVASDALAFFSYLEQQSPVSNVETEETQLTGAHSRKIRRLETKPTPDA